MTIRYPNGKLYKQKEALTPSTKSQQYANRGMTLEEDLNHTNAYYLSQGIAVIHKKPTPLQIVKVDYPKRSAAVIKEAYFKQASTTDYNGVYRGRYIDFEAKETKNKQSFPLNNFHTHQIDHMKHVIQQDGICFVILRFSLYDEIYLLDCTHLFTYWDQQFKGGRKSIPRSFIEQNGFPIKIGFQPRIDYIGIVDKIYFNE